MLLHWLARSFQQYCLLLAALLHSHLSSNKSYLKLSGSLFLAYTSAGLIACGHQVGVTACSGGVDAAGGFFKQLQHVYTVLGVDDAH